LLTSLQTIAKVYLTAQGINKMSITNQPAKIFNTFEKAQKACEGLESNEFRIDLDPKGSGRCLVMMLDDETGEEMGHF